MAKILIVEDDPGIALGVKNDLALEGHEVEVAKDGLTGLERARGGEFNLILLDLMLPKKDGYAICRELRHDGNRTPILMLTAKA
jgi:DNA-binding response OmpR family regulator